MGEDGGGDVRATRLENRKAIGPGGPICGWCNARGGAEAEAAEAKREARAAGGAGGEARALEHGRERGAD